MSFLQIEPYKWLEEKEVTLAVQRNFLFYQSSVFL
jgi:hypothetical protein